MPQPINVDGTVTQCVITFPLQPQSDNKPKSVLDRSTRREIVAEDK